MINNLQIGDFFISLFYGKKEIYQVIGFTDTCIVSKIISGYTRGWSCSSQNVKSVQDVVIKYEKIHEPSSLGYWVFRLENEQLIKINPNDSSWRI